MAQTNKAAQRSLPPKFIPLVFLLPTLLVLLAFQFLPAAYTLYLSMTQLRRGQSEFVGLQHYNLLAQVPSFAESLERTLMYAIPYISLSIVLGMGLALLLNRRVKFTGVYLVIIFMPWVLSDVVAGTMWRWMFQPAYGLVQAWITHNLPMIERPLYTDPNGAMFIVIAASVWQGLAFTTILSLGALQTIPEAINEAAALDGANRLQRFFWVTLPMIRPTMLVLVLLVSMRAINSVGLIFATTGGGPGDATETLAVYLLDMGWLRGRFGIAGAISVVMLAVNLALTALYLVMIGRNREPLKE